VTTTHDADYRDFLAQLRAARLGAGLTQGQVASALGKPQSYVSKCESGERRVDVIELRRFAELYEQPLSYFVPTSRRRGR
jgi:transcriptional regulator with XRE-family HTH domain